MNALCAVRLHDWSKPMPRMEYGRGKQRVVIVRDCMRTGCKHKDLVVARSWIGLGSASVRGEIRRMRAEVVKATR